MDQMFSWMLMECYIDLREEEGERGGGGPLEDGGEGREREQLIFMWPAPSQSGRLGDDGCEGEVGWKEGKERDIKRQKYGS